MFYPLQSPCSTTLKKGGGSELSDFDALVEAVLALGEEILDRGTGRVAVSGAPMGAVIAPWMVLRGL